MIPQKVWTPWDMSQTAKEIAEGIIFYTTASHGGFWLSEERMKRIPAYLKNTFAGPPWFEEDCDWALVMLCIPEVFSMPEKLRAYRSLMMDMGGWKLAVKDLYLKTAEGKAFQAELDAYLQENGHLIQRHCFGLSSCDISTLDGKFKGRCVFKAGANAFDIPWPVRREDLELLAVVTLEPVAAKMA